MASSEQEKEDANSAEYTVILREHENKHHGHSHAHGHVHAAPKTMSSVAWMVIMGDGLHNFTDGKSNSISMVALWRFSSRLYLCEAKLMFRMFFPFSSYKICTSLQSEVKFSFYL